MFTFAAEMRDALPLAASQNGRHRTCGIHEIPQTANSDSNNIKYHTNSKNFLVYETTITKFQNALSRLPYGGSWGGQMRWLPILI